MKKLTALLLCVLLLSVCTVTAFADTVGIDTVVPDSHTVTVNVTGNATATLDGEAGSTFTVARLGEPTLRFTPAEGKAIVKITLNGEDVTDRLVDGGYTLPPVYEDKVLNIEAQTADFVKDDVQWTRGGTEGAVIAVRLSNGNDAQFAHFLGVKLDDKELTEDADYTVNQDGMTVTLSPAVLENLSVGEHTVTVLFDNGEYDTILTVNAANSGDSTAPQTGDNSLMGLWIALMALALCGMACAYLYGGKRKASDR